MSSFIISNIPDYTKMSIAFTLDDAYSTLNLNLKIYSTKEAFTDEDPSYDADKAITTTGDTLVPSDFGLTEDVFIDGLYLFTLTSYDGASAEVESLSNKYLINYNVSIVIALDTIYVSRQLEEDDDKHLTSALWAIWGEILLVGMDRGAATGLLENAMEILDYTNDYTS